jgi:hypothetical protein
VVRVLFFCAAACLPFSVSPFPPACLTAGISWRIDFLCVLPDECPSPSGAVVSRRVTALLVGLLASKLSRLLAAGLAEALPPDILRCASEGYSTPAQLAGVAASVRVL